jgi:MoxR-like ATPase
MDTLKVRASSVKPIILRAMHVNRPIFIWGAPGIGKSELVDGIVQSGDLGNAVTIDLRLALLEPTDLRGYPFRNPDTNTMEWAPAADLPNQEFADQYDTIVLFLDELNSAPPSVQVVLTNLLVKNKLICRRLHTWWC